MSTLVDNQVQQRTYDDGVVDTAVPGWSVECVQMSEGTLHCSARLLYAHSIQVMEERYENATTNHYGLAPSGCLAFVVPVRMRADGLFNGSVWPRGTLCIWDTRSEFEFVMPPMDFFCVVVDLSQFLPSLGVFDGFDGASLLPWTSGPIGSAPMMEQLGAHLRSVVDAAFRSDISTPRLRQALVCDVIEVLAPAVVNAAAHGSRAGDARTNAADNVRRARQFAMEHMDEPLRLSDLCSVLQVSMRNLQYSFQVMLGTSPHAYLRNMRLNGARRDLLEGRSVNDVVEKWGFWHWSRFSRDYRLLFGELPSHTLKKQLAAA